MILAPRKVDNNKNHTLGDEDGSEQKQNVISFFRKTKVATTVSTFALRTF